MGAYCITSVTKTLAAVTDNYTDTDVSPDASTMAEEETTDVLDYIHNQIAGVFGFISSTGSKDVSENVKHVVSALLVLVVFGALFATKSLWWDRFYQMTFANVHCGSIRNCPGVGWLFSNFCPCLGLCGCDVSAYHPHFRLRILMHEAHNFKGTAIFVRAKCGNNPPKSTSMMKIPMSSMYPVVWNEPLDLDITTADENIDMEVVDVEGISCALRAAGTKHLPARK